MRHQKFNLDLGWAVLLDELGLSAEDILRQAQLPPDLFTRKTPSLSTSDYYRLWEALAYLLRDDPAFALKIGQAATAETFSPPLFACYCSPNLRVALERLAQYKPLIGPMRLDITADARQTAIAIAGLPENAPPPASIIAMELVFVVNIARMATRDRITPLAVHVTTALPAAEAYTAYFGCTPQIANFSGLTFANADMEKPFLTANDSMWAVFEPSLRQRMRDLDTAAGFRERVRASLLETIASGQCSMQDTARRLAVSTRTLQRRLREENTSFQQELSSLREELARHYLHNSHYTSAEIAFLLGYKDPNSFFRAFHNWTGQTPEYARAALGQ
jgi:AraC-like DNA-binding protein